MEERETHDTVIREKHLPRVGATVRNRQDGTLWRVMEKKEVWQHTPDRDHLVPAVYLCYWKIRNGELPGLGQLMGYAYTLHDNTFEANWEVV